MKIWPNVIQQSETWFKIRAGRPTASMFNRIISPSGKTSTAWEDYATDLLAESIRPDASEWGGNHDTDRGNALEPEAREDFAQRMGLEVEEVGFVTRDDGIIGCSPDSLIRKDDQWVAGLEIKCPRPGKHCRLLLRGELPDEYKVQVHGSMAVTSLNYWFFLSYCPGCKPLLLRVERDEYTEKVTEALDDFLVYYAERREKDLPKLLP